MDAYDIFKKLTKGLTFKTRILGGKNNGQKKIINTTNDVIKVEVKEEKWNNDELLDWDKAGHDRSVPLQIQPINTTNDFPDVKVKEEITEFDEQIENLNMTLDGNGNESNDENEEGCDGEFQLMTGVKVVNKSKLRKKKKERVLTEAEKSKVIQDELNSFRKVHGIRAVGSEVPPALHSFSALAENDKVTPLLRENLIKCGYTEPTPIQRQAIPCMLEDRQILACAPTGSGKTAAFLLPILQTLGRPQNGLRALILCPTRELAKQIHREALRLSAGTNLRCNMIKKIIEKELQQRLASLNKSDLVISTPNRLCYLLNQQGSKFSLQGIRWLVIDEADKMFEGSADKESDFRRQLQQVMTASDNCNRRVAMFSATHTQSVAEWCQLNMLGLINIEVGLRNSATELVEQELLYCGTERGKLIAFRQLVQQGLQPPVLVFVQSKDRAKELFKELIYDGINVDAIHADRTQLQRDNVVKSFRLGKIWVLICTELMGRGIDFRGVNLVVNYDFPPSAIAYIHRIGRAGRAGQRGRAVTYFTQDDVVNLRSIAAVMKHSGCEVPEYMLAIKQNTNARKRVAKIAPKRDKISTRLEVHRKRKHSDSDQRSTEVKSSKSGNKLYYKYDKKHEKSTTNIKTTKKPKHRKIEKKNLK